MTNHIYPPWTEEQVETLNDFQESGLFHPFTCDEQHELIATDSGWFCPVCPGYYQNWAWDWMADRNGWWNQSLDTEAQ